LTFGRKRAIVGKHGTKRKGTRLEKVSKSGHVGIYPLPEDVGGYRVCVFKDGWEYRISKVSSIEEGLERQVGLKKLFFKAREGLWSPNDVKSQAELLGWRVKDNYRKPAEIKTNQDKVSRPKRHLGAWRIYFTAKEGYKTSRSWKTEEEAQKAYKDFQNWILEGRDISTCFGRGKKAPGCSAVKETNFSKLTFENWKDNIPLVREKIRFSREEGVNEIYDLFENSLEGSTHLYLKVWDSERKDWVIEIRPNTETCEEELFSIYRTYQTSPKPSVGVVEESGDLLRLSDPCGGKKQGTYNTRTLQLTTEFYEVRFFSQEQADKALAPYDVIDLAGSDLKLIKTRTK